MKRKRALRHRYGRAGTRRTRAANRAAWKSWDRLPDEIAFASDAKKREREEMEEILMKRGFSSHHAKALQNEGMGPFELRSRAAIPPHEVGGLTYTHGIKKERA